MEHQKAAATKTNITTTTTEETMSDTQRLIPAAMHRIRYTQGNIAVIDYADDRAEAVAYAAKVNGKVECYVYGVGWQAIEKVNP